MLCLTGSMKPWKFYNRLLWADVSKLHTTLTRFVCSVKQMPYKWNSFVCPLLYLVYFAPIMCLRFRHGIACISSLSSLIAEWYSTIWIEKSLLNHLPLNGHLYFQASVQFSSVAQSCPTLCDPMNHSTPWLLLNKAMNICVDFYIDLNFYFSWVKS